jgi:peptidoglycan/LPS O-acetylase OafA/YrhL
VTDLAEPRHAAQTDGPVPSGAGRASRHLRWPLRIEEPKPAYGPSLGRGVGYLPGIDGLRALAVVAVLAYHLDASWAAGGYLGVEVFFVVSGFLITSLLLAEHRDAGTIDLLGFWRRRARRLLPAVFVLVGLVLAYAAVALPTGELRRFRGDGIASLLYVQNWHAVLTEQPYFEAFGRPSPLRHLWSLAIEEQFYLFWPVLLPLGLRRLGRRRTVVAVAFAIALSAILMAATSDITSPERAYYGTDTRLFGILAGALLAFAWRPQRARGDVGTTARRVIEGSGVSALALLAWQHAHRSEFDAWTYPWGFVLVDVLTLVAIIAVTHPASRLERTIGSGTLQALGRRSYSIYLWHWPVIVFTRPGVDWGFTGASALALRLLLVAALAEASYRFIEQPVRDGTLQRWLTGAALPAPAGVLRRRRAVGAVAVASLVLAVAAIAAPVGPGREMAVGAVADQPSAITLPPTPPSTAPTPTPTPTPTDDTTPPPTSAPAADPAAPPTTAAPTPPPPELPASAYYPVTVVGESVTLGAAPALQAHWGHTVQIDAVEARQFEDGVRAIEAFAAEGRLTPVVVVHLGNNGVAPPGALERVVAAVGPERRLVLVSVRVPRRWEGQVNGEVLRTVAAHPNVLLADWNTTSASEPGLLIDDGVHLTARGHEVYRDLIVQVTGG